jgi:multicomponent Na+:H+ antiporter subunit B
MSLGVRLLLCGLGMLILVPACWKVAMHMPEFGAHALPYGDAINQSAPAERHVSNMVSAVNFDYRAIDTLGEEFMLLCAVTGAVVLLRGSRGEQLTSQPASLPDRLNAPRSNAITLIGRLMGPIIMVFGIYVVLHATVTPGGGFQGGVIISSGLLLLYLGEDYGTWRELMRSRVFDALEGGGALAFVLAGVPAVVAGKAFLENTLDYGTFRTILSGGLMLVENAGVAFAVLAGFSLLFIEFLEETRAPRDGE